MGHVALKLNQTGADNTAVGVGALFENTTASNNTAVGKNALNANTTGADNNAFGHGALDSCTTGGDNNAFGRSALGAITTGGSNCGFGHGAMDAVVSGSGNTGMGQNVLTNCTGSNNTAVGYQAGFSTTSPAQNVFMGYQAGYDNTTGQYNVCIGPNQAGNGLTTGGFNIYMGYLSRASAGGVGGELVLATGNSTQTGKGDNTGFINASNGVYQGNNSSSWSTTSDRRIKKNIEDNTTGLDAINQIRVRNFEYRTEDEITEVPTHAAINKEGVQLGVIAQEIETILPDVVREESTGVKTVNPDNLTWYLVNAVQELSTQVDELKQELKTLKGE